MSWTKSLADGFFKIAFISSYNYISNSAMILIAKMFYLSPYTTQQILILHMH